MIEAPDEEEQKVNINEICHRCGYDTETYEQVTLVDRIAAGSTGFTEERWYANENTIDAVVSVKKGKGKGSNKVCLKCGNKGHIAANCNSQSTKGNS